MSSGGPPRVRLVRETLALYASVAVRLGASIVFTILIARYLTVTEFAMYGVVSALSLLIPQAVQLWSFWANRRAVWEWREGRQRVSGRTGLATTLVFMIVMLPVYALFSLVESLVLGWDLLLLMAGYPYLALNSLVVYTRDLSSTVKPEGYARSRILFDVLRLLLAIPLVAMLGLGYLGALAATIAALLVSQAYMLAYLYRLGALGGRVDWRAAREWLGRWRVPLYQVVGDLLRHAPRPYVSLLTASDLAVAYLNVGVTGQSALLQTAQMTQPALYARLLRDPKRSRDVRVSLQLYSVFAGLILGTFLFLARPLASLFNPEYLEASWAIQLVAVYSLLLGAANIFRTVIIALDQEDRETGLPGEAMRRAMRLYVAYTLGAYIAAAPLVWALRGDPALSVAVFLGVLAVSALLLLVSYATYVRSMIHVELPYRTLASVVVGLAGMGVYYWVRGVGGLVVYSIIVEGPRLFVEILVGSLVYLGLLALLDPWVRGMVSRLRRRQSSRRPL